MENNKQGSKALSARAVETMRPGDTDKADSGENVGLRVSCGATGVRTFYYRYRSPETEKLTQFKLGTYPTLSLAQARVELACLKEMRAKGICPKAALEASISRRLWRRLSARGWLRWRPLPSRI